jgi:hypothetical protein
VNFTTELVVRWKQTVSGTHDAAQAKVNTLISYAVHSQRNTGLVYSCTTALDGAVHDLVMLQVPLAQPTGVADFSNTVTPPSTLLCGEVQRQCPPLIQPSSPSRHHV